MRRSVDLPAPLAQRIPSASPSFTSNDTPASATAVGFSNGWKKVRQPLRAGGNDFARASTVIAASGTRNLIACLRFEDNRDSLSVCARQRKSLCPEVLPSSGRRNCVPAVLEPY